MDKSYHKLADAYGNNSGVVFIGNEDGSYTAYINPEIITVTTKNGWGGSTEVQQLNRMAGVNSLLFNARAKFLKFLGEKK